ncbi:MAG: SDR family NAD(P)-dependent oxidoreductase [Anaerolineales bacterium]|nr:SDR family NAD(P)-dependent oxidoreductase [Anaerolineales bacterium]
MIDKGADSHILITGGAGYIGSSLTAALLDAGCYVTVVDKLLFGGEPLLSYFPNPNFHFLQGDVGDSGCVRQAVQSASQRGAPPLDAVVHLAAIVGFPACKALGREASWNENVEVVKVMFEEADQLGASRFLFSSTYSNYGLSDRGEPVTEESPLYPQSLYAETKIAAEQYLQDSTNGASCAPLVFRLATLFGASARMRFDLIVNQFVLDAYFRKELVIYQRNYSRSFVHVQDVVRGFLLGLQASIEEVRGQIFNLGTEQGNFTKDEVVSMICDSLPETRVRYEDLDFSDDMRDLRVSFAKIRDQLGYRAERAVDEGIDEVLSLLSSGLISDPFSDRYRNADFAVQ